MGGTSVGNAESVKPSESALRETGLALLKIKAALEQQIAALVPGNWEGEGAQAFRQLVDRQIDRVLEMEGVAKGLGVNAEILRDGLSWAELQYQKAEQHAAEHKLFVDGQLVVRPLPETEPLAGTAEVQTAIAQVQDEVDYAKRYADEIRDAAMRNFQQSLRDILLDIMPQTGVGKLKAGISALKKPKAGVPPGVKRLPSGRFPPNYRYAGRVYDGPRWTPELAKKYPNGVRFNDQGFPEFGPYAKVTVTIEPGSAGNYTTDFAEANGLAGDRLPKNMDDYTWHHHEDRKTMQLVPWDLHDAIRHAGGVSLK
jgi:hypothetical protein